MQGLQNFKSNLVEADILVAHEKKLFNPIRKIQITARLKKLEKSIREFIQDELPLVMASAQLDLLSQLRNVPDTQGTLNAQAELPTEIVEISRQGRSLCGPLGIERSQQDEILCGPLGIERSQQDESLCGPLGIERPQQDEGLCGPLGIERSQQDESLCGPLEIERSQQDKSLRGPPDMPTCFVGFGEHVVNLKNILLQDRVNVVGVTAMGGAGKSTLAAAICKDNEIREYFAERVLYIEVSESPDIHTILITMWRDIIGSPVPHFTNVEDQHNKLQGRIKLRNQPILLVLDDIWSRSHLEKLLFEGTTYKTLVTTRDKNVILPKGPKTLVYELPLLQQEHALSLFCHRAFGKPTIPASRDKELVIKVQQQCSGLPLALKVIGISLYGKSDSVWERAEKRLSAGEPFEDSIRNILETSIDVLDEIEKQCFLDLGAIPQGKAIPAKALRDIWVYVRGMKSSEADMLLWKFALRHLLDFKKNPGTSEITDDIMDGLCVSQHSLVRDFALYLAKQENSRRLYITKMENHMLSEWEVLSSKAHIVSIHTGEMEDTQWTKMEFPEVEALVLYFTASEYCIPTFLRTMKNLKVLIIHNDDGARRCKLSGVAGFQELSQLKALHLERLIVPEECKLLKSLEKIYMGLCEGLGSNKAFNIPGLLEFNVSYCIDLEEIPAGLCSSVSLKRLLVAHCHRLAKLPDELDKLESLKEIKLRESPCLKTLPSSMCRLKKLKLLDISSCIHLKVNKEVRCELKETLKKLTEVPSLKRVICDKNNEWLFKRSSRVDLKVEAVEEKEPNLDWRDWEGRKLVFG